MFSLTRRCVVFSLLLFSCILYSCKSKHAAAEKQIVATPADMDPKVSENIRAVLQYALEGGGKINDSIKLSLPNIVDSFYRKSNYKQCANVACAV